MQENNFNTTVQSLFKGMDSFITTKTVVGEAVHIGDTIILPLIDVSFGVGAGSSGNKGEKDSKGKSAGGLGAKITPSAILVVQNGTVQLVNVKNTGSVDKLLNMVPGILSKFNLKKDKTNDEKAVDNDENL